jgi:hypothetical protein
LEWYSSLRLACNGAGHDAPAPSNECASLAGQRGVRIFILVPGARGIEISAYSRHP